MVIYSEFGAATNKQTKKEIYTFWLRVLKRPVSSRLSKLNESFNTTQETLQ